VPVKSCQQFHKLELLHKIDEKQLTSWILSTMKATVQLSRDTVTTSPDVWPMLFRLRSLCKISGADSDTMRELESAFLISLDENYVIHPLYKLSTLVEPSYKYLSFLDTGKRESAHSELRSMVDKIVLAHSISDESAVMDADSIGESKRKEGGNCMKRMIHLLTSRLLRLQLFTVW
jgi:hypothetical protein